LKTYRQDAWRQFYIFDIFSDESDCYLNYESIAEVCSAAHVNYVVPLCEIHNATYDNLLIELKNNTFLIEDGQGAGEGIVIKNYDFQNRFGRTTWAKITTSEFKEKHAREMGAPSKVMKAMTEQAICDEYLTAEMVDKVYANIVNECGGWNSKYIPRLLMTSFYDLVNEEMWAILKKFKNPTVNFKTLYSLVILKIKNQLRPELF